MKIGIHFPQGEIGSDHHVIRDFVQTAEELGFNFINVPDHVVQTRTPRGPLPLANNYTTAFPHHETMTTLAFIAGVTQTLQPQVGRHYLATATSGPGRQTSGPD